MSDLSNLKRRKQKYIDDDDSYQIKKRKTLPKARHNFVTPSTRFILSNKLH